MGHLQPCQHLRQQHQQRENGEAKHTSQSLPSVVRQIHEGKETMMDDFTDIAQYISKLSGYEAAAIGIDCPQRDAYLRELEREAR